MTQTNVRIDVVEPTAQVVYMWNRSVRVFIPYKCCEHCMHWGSWTFSIPNNHQHPCGNVDNLGFKNCDIGQGNVPNG